MKEYKVAVIGGGLAGSECAWILANTYGIHVTLFEMKKIQPTPAQISPNVYSELVCSNSLKSKSHLNPAGVLKNEMLKLGSLILPIAYKTEVPAGETLAVDRLEFSTQITQALKSHSKITTIDMVVDNVDQIFKIENFDAVVIATGPLTSQSLSEDLIKITNSKDLYFYDAIAPILDGDSIDYDIAFKANRKTKTHAYEKKKAKDEDHAIKNESENLELQIPNGEKKEEEGDYLNLPFNKEEYEQFVTLVLQGDKVPHHEFEEPRYFNGCQPIEALAQSGPRTLSFGPMKARGLDDPRTGRWPHAVVQLRKENLGDTAWSMVGFQTRLTWGAQKQIFKTIPGLKNVEFFRMGSMHRNTYMVSPNILNEDFSFKVNSKLYLAGQIMGVEGYLESAAMGVYIAHTIGQKLVKNKTLPLPPPNTSLGALAHYCLYEKPAQFCPMNIHWGLFSELTKEEIVQLSESKNLKINLNAKKLDKSLKRDLLATRSEILFNEWIKNFIHL